MIATWKSMEIFSFWIMEKINRYRSVHDSPGPCVYLQSKWPSQTWISHCTQSGNETFVFNYEPPDVLQIWTWIDQLKNSFATTKRLKINQNLSDRYLELSRSKFNGNRKCILYFSQKHVKLFIGQKRKEYLYITYNSAVV